MAKKFTRRTFLRTGGIAALGTALTGVYARWGEAQWLEVDRVTIPRTARPDAASASAAVSPGATAAAFAEGATAAVVARPAVRILHLSDLHHSAVVPLEYIAEAITLGLAQKPDLAVITGDFVTFASYPESNYAATLSRLAEAVPTFACMGNHDADYAMLRQHGLGGLAATLSLLQRAGITALVNEHRELALHGRRVQLVGMGDLWSGLCLPGLAFNQLPQGNDVTRVVLCHNPDAKTRFQTYDWDVMLCGHTHGGQVCLPLIGPPHVPVQDRRFVSGLHAWEDRWIYITHGVGNIAGIRLNCRPQVSVVDLA